MIRFDNVYPVSGYAWDSETIRFLYALLEERDPAANISHRQMPTFDEHVSFVHSKPYSQWWLIVVEGPVQWGAVGACYLTKPPRASVAGNEIGIQIAKTHQRKGCATAALDLLIQMNPGRRLLANIAPGNAASQALFAKFGFTLCQHTLERMP